MKLDLTQSRTIPDGVYPVRITEVEMKESQNSEYPYFQWELELTEGPKAGETVMEITTLSPKALFRLKALAVATGYDWPDEEEQDELDFDPKELLGKEVLVELTTEEYKGQKRNRVKSFISIEDRAEVEEKQQRRGGRGK